ncbi:glutaminyl-peptide cyclotransferase [Sphingomonas sp. 3-13AW]|jgi:glutamine cyclotransferase|uniref:glutaminyl-peptide cyclotransferase n=1 Tax=Sphingomonas sp. 3-13AW TaxID=3050450 RepID=UPI003BB7B9F2
MVLAVAATLVSGAPPRIAIASQVAAPTAPAPAPALVYPITARIVARYPHDPKAFTEGLLWHDGALYESIGLEGRSEVRRVRLEDGKVLARATLPADQFGEGLALWNGTLVSLTWTTGIAHRWDAKTLRHLGSFRYTGEGWGLASDGRMLVQSDGSPVLRFRDPESFKVRRELTVTANGLPVRNLNEVEVVDGAIYANVWHRNYLVRIDPESGAVTGLVDLSPLVAEIAATDPEAVANGIAWDPAKRRLFVTGKLWPTLFEIALEPAG